MVLDKEDHRASLLQLIAKASFPGEFAEEVAELKAAIRDAKVKEPAKPESAE